METSFILYYMPLIKNIVNTMFCSSIIIVFTLMYFVSNVNNVKLSNHRKLELMVTGVLFHLIAYLGLPRMVSPLICIFGFGVWFALLMDISIKKSFVSVFVWYIFTLIIELPIYMTLINFLNFDLSTSIGNYQYYIVCLTSNIVILLLTIIITKVVTTWKDMAIGSQEKRQK